MTPAHKLYQTSKYNHFFKIEDRYLGTNLLSWAILSLDSNQYKLVTEFLSLSRNPKTEDETAIFRLLLNKRFIHLAGTDENDYLRRLYKLNTQSRNSFSLGLAVTLNCNFRCPYCYQEHSAERMPRDTQRAVLAFLAKELPRKRSFSVSWWGGEPLLEMRTIESLGTEIMSLCDRIGVSYSCSMSTNGYLLSDKNIGILKKGRLNHIQITLDGSRKSHDKIRVLRDGRGTYDVLVRNLRRLVELVPGIYITVRVNISTSVVSTETEGWAQLLTDLLPIKDHIAIAPREVLPAGNFDQMCISSEQFDAFYDKVGELTHQLGFRVAFGVHGIGTAYCGAMPIGNWLVHPKGYLGKCTAYAHRPEAALGRLRADGTVELYEAAQSWLRYSPWDSAKCGDCSYLPICMGGCRNIAFTESGYVDRCRIGKELSLMIRNRLAHNLVGGVSSKKWMGGIG